MWVDDIERPNYWDGQYLGPADFAAAVEYARERQRRLNVGQHTWGIYRGLDLVERPRAGGGSIVDLSITPGFAIDGFGRELFVFRPMALPIDAFQRYPSEKWVQVWLRYDTESRVPPAPGFEDCDHPDAAYRTLETVKLELGDSGELSRVHDPIRVDGRAIVENEYPRELSIPFQSLPDDEELTASWWLVPIGYAHWDGAGGFVKATAPVDETKRRKGRVYGGDVAAHTYAPDGTWELVAGKPDISKVPADPADPLVRPDVAATVRGSLLVTRIVVAKDRVRLDGGPLSFAPGNGDEAVPITLTRLGKPTDPGAVLELKLGNAINGDSRFAVRSSGTTDRFSVTDAGDAVVGRNLSVANVLTVKRAEKDSIVLHGATDAPNAAALGLEAGSSILYTRAPGGLRVYLDEATADPTHQAMQVDSGGVSIRHNLLVGWGGNGHIRTRHIDGKNFANDATDGLYLNYDNGHDVVVGNVGGTSSDLYVSGNLFLGPNKVPIEAPIDVQTGRLSSIMPSTWPIGTVGGVTTQLANGSRNFRIKSTALKRIGPPPQVSVALSDVFNASVATNARWHVSASTLGRIDDLTWEFQLNWLIQDDAVIFDAIYTAVFYP